MNLLRVSFLAGAIAALCGCGSDLVNVKGSVEREGSPLLAGKVVMTPVGGGRVAFGEIQSDGSFRLTSERANDGAAPGNIACASSRLKLPTQPCYELVTKDRATSPSKLLLEKTKSW